MKAIYSILSFLLVASAFGCRINYPFEYLAQNGDVIIVGEIEKMDYDLPHEAPYEDSHYSLAYVRIDEILKSDIDLKEKEYFTFRVASKKDGEGTTATIFWDKGMKGTWFFQREDDPHGWVGTTLKPVDVAEKVKKELSYTHKRRFGKSYNPWQQMEAKWPDGLGDETSLLELSLHLDVARLNGKSDVGITLHPDLFPGLKIKKVDFDQPMIKALRDIVNQHENLDFEYGDFQVVLFDRTKADQGGAINSEAAASPR